MKYPLFSLLCAILSASAVADLKKLDGTWKPISGVMGTTHLRKSLLDSMVLTLKGGRYDYNEGHGHDLGRMKEVGHKAPLGLDIIGTEGPNKGRTFLSIYKCDGKTLTICYSTDGKRPTSFDVKGKTTLLLMTYKRTGK